MKSRQTLPREWLIIEKGATDGVWKSVRRLSRGSGILLIGPLEAQDFRRLRRMAALRSLKIVDETSRAAARIHNVRELRHALLRRTRLVLLSPLYPTTSHPEWTPLPRMRAATLAQLGHRRVIALGGMNEERYAKVAPLGFIGWAGISAFRT